MPLPIGLRERVAENGVEPLLSESKSDVLPLDDSAINKKPDLFGVGL
jgi:hypothetical protein